MAAPTRVLIVDDHAVVRAGLRLLLAQEDDIEPVGEAGSARDAIFEARSTKPDVILLDVVMPDMNGFELCKKIREAVPNRFTPVVFVTGQSDFDARVQMSRNGGDDLMGKPFLTSELTVKTLTFALRGSLQRIKTQLKAQPAL